MIDPELDQLSRALIAATDRLNSEDFRERQSRYVRDELALRELAEGLEADEKAVEDAQAALTAHISANYVAVGVAKEPPTRFVSAAELFDTDSADDPFFSVRVVEDEDDDTPEESTARSAGALS